MVKNIFYTQDQAKELNLTITNKIDFCNEFKTYLKINFQNLRP